MINRDAGEIYPRRAYALGEVALKVDRDSISRTADAF
jgi:hypothetical protein